MKRASIRVREPTPELIEIIRRARVAIFQQEPRCLKCPYCQHNALLSTRTREVMLNPSARNAGGSQSLLY